MINTQIYIEVLSANKKAPTENGRCDFIYFLSLIITYPKSKYKGIKV